MTGGAKGAARARAGSRRPYAAAVRSCSDRYSTLAYGLMLDTQGFAHQAASAIATTYRRTRAFAFLPMAPRTGYGCAAPQSRRRLQPMGASIEHASANDVEFPCRACGVPLVVPCDGQHVACPGCNATYTFRSCGRCSSINQVSPKAKHGGWWTCAFCGSANRGSVVGHGDLVTADLYLAELRGRRLTDARTERLVSGFTVVGGNGLDLPVGANCSVLTTTDGVLLQAEVDDRRSILIPYGDITAVDVGGGRKTTGPAIFGGGFGVQGALEGMLAASVLNSAMRQTSINTGMHIASVGGEVFLHHGHMTSDAVRRVLSPLWTRYDGARRETSAPAADPTEMLARLKRLCDAGVLTEEEFASKKAELMARI